MARAGVPDRQLAHDCLALGVGHGRQLDVEPSAARRGSKDLDCGGSFFKLSFRVTLPMFLKSRFHPLGSRRR